jgi:hypothetical protein
MPRFADEAEAGGWRIHRASLGGRVSVPRLVIATLDDVTTTYVIRMDGDTRPRRIPAKRSPPPGGRGPTWRASRYAPRAGGR